MRGFTPKLPYKYMAKIYKKTSSYAINFSSL
ncbi:hypothetical protein XACS582_14700003 [Xanthomonas citri pv. citri]|nr:hypothetical protein XACS582_14700003 [Xanthomonas citri pv. citri]CEI02579.1 hypothetical protein XACS581_3230001 [Xanthomonas citri pv. citri]